MSDESTAVTVAPEQPRTLLSAIVQMASDPAIDVAKLDALLQMQERTERRQAEIEFNQALARLSGQMPRVKKKGKVDLGSGKSYAFAKFEDMDRIIRPMLDAEGFTLSFTSQMREGGGLVVVGTLMHRAGHSMAASMPLPLDTGPARNNLQATGSTLSYGKRYCAEMLLNIVREGDDNDGRGGSEPIDDESVKRLTELIAETKSDLKGFLKFLNVVALVDIRQGDYSTAINALLAKKAKVAT